MPSPWSCEAGYMRAQHQVLWLILWWVVLLKPEGFLTVKLQTEGFEMLAVGNICLRTGHHTRFSHSFPGTVSLCSTSGPKGLVHSTGGCPSSLDLVQFQVITDVCVEACSSSRQPGCSFAPVELLFPQSLFLFHCPLFLLWNAPFLTKEPAGGFCLNEPAASGNRGFSSPGLLVEATGGHCQLVALRVALCMRECDGCSSWKCRKGEKRGMR